MPAGRLGSRSQRAWRVPRARCWSASSEPPQPPLDAPPTNVRMAGIKATRVKIRMLCASTTRGRSAALVAASTITAGKGTRHRGATRGDPVPAMNPLEIDRAGEQSCHDRQGKQCQTAGPSLHLRHALRRGARAHGDAEQHECDVAQARRQANRQVRHRRCDDGHHGAGEPRCRQAKRREQRTARGGDRHGQQQPANRAKIGASACCWWAHRERAPR